MDLSLTRLNIEYSFVALGAIASTGEIVSFSESNSEIVFCDIFKKNLLCLCKAPFFV